LVIWFELSSFGYKNYNCNLQVHVLQLYAHNICIVYNIKEVDLKMFNFWWSFGVLTIKDSLYGKTFDEKRIKFDIFDDINNKIAKRH
jgi:hypothetical protein